MTGTSRPKRSLGPAIVVAAVVCGPGSLLISSKVGAALGPSAAWVVGAACVLMVGTVSLSTRIGVSFAKTPCGEIAARFGRPAAAFLGLVTFAIIACFQASNDLAIASALEAFGRTPPRTVSIGVLIALNLAVAAFLLRGREQYHRIEQAMKFLVAVMVLAFVTNWIVAKPDLRALAAGFVPAPRSLAVGENGWLLVALTGTTFSVAGAFYQAYLVREKRWTEADRRLGAADAVIGIAALGGISLVVLSTSASAFPPGPDGPVELSSAADVARQLEPAFGARARWVFGAGLLAAALSSFLVNALIGGHVLADGLGRGDRLESRATRRATLFALGIGAAAAIASLATQTGIVQWIVLAQALTVIGVPALAAALLYLGLVLRRRDPAAMPRSTLLLAALGLGVTALLAARTVHGLLERFSNS